MKPKFYNLSCNRCVFYDTTPKNIQKFIAPCCKLTIEEGLYIENYLNTTSCILGNYPDRFKSEMQQFKKARKDDIEFLFALIGE